MTIVIFFIHRHYIFLWRLLRSTTVIAFSLIESAQSGRPRDVFCDFAMPPREPFVPKGIKDSEILGGPDAPQFDVVIEAFEGAAPAPRLPAGGTLSEPDHAREDLFHLTLGLGVRRPVDDTLIAYANRVARL